MKNNRTLWLATILIFVILGIFALVLAETSTGELNPAGIDGSVSLEEGWNLVTPYAINNIQDEELKAKQIRAVFMYDRYKREYIRAYPNKETDKFNIFTRNVDIEQGADRSEYAAFTNSAWWVYSDVKQTLNFHTTDGPFYLSYVSLKRGWNFLAITPEMKGTKIGDAKGTCIIEKIGDYRRNNWDIVVPNENNVWADQERDLWYGIIVKVSNDCKLGNGESIENPPDLPTSP